ncbi:MAG: putative sugar nucleotidyl transferase [bacterium]
MSAGFLALFEDAFAPRFAPVALTRSVAGLRLGAWTHRERWEHLFPERSMLLVCRESVAARERALEPWEAVNDVPPADVLFVAAALGRAGADVVAAIRALESGGALVAEGRIVAARASGEAAGRLGAALREAIGASAGAAGSSSAGTAGAAHAGDGPRLLAGAGLRSQDVPVAWPRTLVDLIRANEDALREDVQAYRGLLRSVDAAAHPHARFVRPERVHVAEGVRVDAGAVLDASEGPILLGPGSRIMANAVVTGPVAIGRDGRVKPLGRVSATSLGPVCRVGGEVDGCILLGFSNKQHDGFLGHSYLGAWVNLGAATDTSDLKNDYGPVRVTLGGETIDTGDMHVGSLIGDHTKTAIHTRLNTGTVLGVCCNVLGADFPPKSVPSFTWGGDGAWSEYRIDKAMEVARVVMARRDTPLSPEDEALLRALHRASEPERRAFLAGA